MSRVREFDAVEHERAAKAGAVTDAIARFYGRGNLPFVRWLASAGRNAATLVNQLFMKSRILSGQSAVLL